MKRFEINVGKGYGPMSSELAVNGNISVEVKDLTGAVSFLPCVFCIAISEVIEIHLLCVLLHGFNDKHNVLLTVQIKRGKCIRSSFQFFNLREWHKLPLPADLQDRVYTLVCN